MEATRVALVTAIEALRATYTDSSLVVEYDNRIGVDPAQQTNPYLSVQLKFVDGLQADISDTPIHRLIGQLYLVAWVRKNTGSTTANNLLEHFYKGLQRRQFGSVRVKMAIPVKQVEVADWVGFPVILPYWKDEVTS